MIAEAGAFALILALALSIAQVALSVAGRIRRSAPLAGAGEGAALGAFLAVAVAFAALMHAFVVSDFSVANVAQNSHSAKPCSTARPEPGAATKARCCSGAWRLPALALRWRAWAAICPWAYGP